MSIVQRVAVIGAIVAVPLGIAGISQALSDTPGEPSVPSSVRVGEDGTTRPGSPTPTQPAQPTRPAQPTQAPVTPSPAPSRTSPPALVPAPPPVYDDDADDVERGGRGDDDADDG
ncbi:hypothetical protein [Actinomadura viridis]|uniref:Small hydrophilic protein n=1 Tax=Actinomadura viridis TaxID=58110 RepID=A0A931GH67_9ACTN|nr:hypothetical protein [Actinomadura viridis]MBG6086522.1 hypothetical protein [Actinomadura viridis]